MKTISRKELQIIFGVLDPGTLNQWEKERAIPQRIGENNHSPFFDLKYVILYLESRAFPYKVRPTALDELRELNQAGEKIS